MSAATRFAHCNLELQWHHDPRFKLARCNADDNIVVLRAASRAEPPRTQGNLSLSFSKGIVFDANAANRLLERLRKVWHSNCLR